jgi:hypothetical protein
MSEIERTVRVGLMTYIAPNGAHTVALEGAVVKVHPDHVARFDRLNRLAGEPEPEPAVPATVVKRRPGRPRKVVEES